jgi:hypothetical protein
MNDLLFHEKEGLVIRQKSNLVSVIRLLITILKKLQQIAPRASPFGQVIDNDGIIRERTSPFIVITSRFADEVSDIHQYRQLNDEGTNSDDNLSIRDMHFNSCNFHHEAGAAIRQLQASGFAFCNGPVEGYSVVAGD